MAKINPKLSYNDIPDLNTSWEDKDPSNGKYWSGQSIENFIKKKMLESQNKMGATYFDRESMRQYSFRSAEDKDNWLQTKDSALVQGEDLFNFSGTVNQVKVINEVGDSANLYFTTQSKEAILTCSFISQEKGITDSSWNDVNEDFEVTVSVDKGSVGSFINIITSQRVLNGSNLSFNIRESIGVGINRVRVTARGVESGATGSFTYTVNLTTMYLAPSNFTWYLPFVEGRAFSLGGMNIGGNLQKVLRIKVTKEESYYKEYEVNIGTTIYVGTAYSFDDLEFPEAGTGVYNVDIWLDADGLTSEHLNYNIICVKAEDQFTAQLISLSEAPSQVYNFAENKLFNYCLYNGGNTTGSPHITLDGIINTNKVNIKSEVLRDVPTGQALEYLASVEIETEEADVKLSATMTYGNVQQIIYPVDNAKAFPASKDAVFYINAAQRSNAQENREAIVNALNSKEYTAEWYNMAWTERTDGWTVDDENRKCLFIPAYSKVNIDYQPLANLTKPVTIEFLYKVKNASDYNDPIITVCDNPSSSDFRGIKITPKNICVQTRNLKDAKKQDYNTIDEQVLDVIITIIPNYKTNYGNLAQIYCNGGKLRSFEFTSIGEWDTKANIILGNNTADLYLYKMRVYNKAFDKSDAIQNFLNSLPSSLEKEAMKSLLLSPTDDSYDLDYDTCVRNGLNTMVIEMLGGKDIPSLLNQEEGLRCNLQINIRNLIEGDLDEEMADLLSGILMEDQSIEGQGTTAMTYGRWNFRWKLDSKYNKRRITAKKNVASAMHSHKMGSTRFFNYLHKACVGANEANASVAVRQYPVYGFVKVLADDGKTYSYKSIGLYTVGADKGDKHTFGYDNKDFKSTLIHLEGSDHTPKTVGFDYPWEQNKYQASAEAMGAVQSNGSVVGAWEVGAAGEYETDSDSDESAIQDMLDQEFKPAYEVAYKNSPFILNTTSVEEMNADPSTWMSQTTENGDSFEGFEFWDSAYDLYYYNKATKRYEFTGVNMLSDLNIEISSLEGLSRSEINNLFINSRKERFVRDWGNYWHTDDAIFHYTFCLLIGATDNYKKNTYPYKFKPLSEGGKWRWRADDLDTIFDINNQGLAAKSYSILVGDKTDTGSGSIYRGDNSAFWTLIKETQDTEIRNMVHRIFDAMVAHPKAEGANTQEKLVGCIKYFYWNLAQEYFPVTAYNSDTEWTYEDIWANKNAWREVNPLAQALGGHYEAEKDWVTMRMLFCASYYNYGAFTASGYADVSTGQLTYGGASAHTYNITPVIDMNPTIIRGSTETITYGDRVKAGETVELTVSNSTGSDTRIYVQGLDWIKDLGDLSNLIVTADNPELGISSKRLQTLKVGDTDATKIPEEGTIKALKFGSCPSMMLVDAQNLTSLTGTVDLSQLPRLQEALFGGTSVTAITLPSGAKIARLQLPDSLTELKLSNLKFLTSDGLEYQSLDNIALFRVENCEQLNPFEILKSIYYNSTELEDIRLVGFIYDGDATDVDMLAALADGPYYGLNPEGERVDVPVIEGTLNIKGAIYKESEDTIKQKYGGGLIFNVDGGYYVKFTDQTVQDILKVKIGDGIGVTEQDIKDTTNISTWFKDNKTIETFDEFEKFTGVTSLNNSYNTNYGTFNGCTSLKSVAIPASVTYIGGGAFQGCTILEDVGDLSNVKTTHNGSFADTPALAIDIYMPSLTEMLGSSFLRSGITKFHAPNLPSIPADSLANNGAFTDCVNLEEVSVPLATTIGKSAFGGCLELKKVEIGNCSSLGDYTFNQCAKLSTIICDWSKVTSIGSSALHNCTSLSFEDLQLPNLTSLGQNAFYGVKIKKLVLGSNGVALTLPTATTSTQNFGDKSVLEEVVLHDGVVGISGPVFYNYTSLTSVNLNYIKSWWCSAGEQTFYKVPIEEFSLPSLETLSGTYASHFMNSSVKKIISLGKVATIPSGDGNYGFALKCKNLEYVNLPESLTSVGNFAFSECINLNVNLVPNTLTHIGTNAFCKCKMDGVVINCPNLVTINNNAFFNTGITRIENLGTVETLGISSGNKEANGVFGQCPKLTYVELPSTITFIGLSTFYKCTSLDVVLCHASTPPSLASSVFDQTNNCPIYVPDGTATWEETAEDGTVTTVTGTIVERYKQASGWVDYADRIYPISLYELGGIENIMEFEDEAVEAVLLQNMDSDSNGYITKDEVEDVTSIGTWFKGNTAIETFDEFEKFTGVNNLGTANSTAYESFSGCTYLKTIKLPRTITIINASSFRNCTSLYHIEGLDNVESIGRTFANCTSLNQPIIMPNLTKMNLGGCFANCPITKFSAPKLTSIPDGLQDSGTNYGVFHKCTNLTEVDLDWENMTKIGGNAFNGCTSLSFEELNLPNLTSLGQNAFYGVKIKKMVLGSDGVTLTLPTATTSSQNFGDKSVLEEVELHGVTSIPNNSFCGYTNLTISNFISNEITSIGGSAFYNTKLKGEINLPSLTGVITSYTFGKTQVEKVTNLGSITGLTNSTTSTGAPFYQCMNLKLAILPETLTVIGGYIFSGCSNLETIVCRAIEPPTVYSTSIPSQTIIYVPDESVEAYKTATNWSTYADRIKPLSEYVES